MKEHKSTLTGQSGSWNFRRKPFLTAMAVFVLMTALLTAWRLNEDTPKKQVAPLLNTQKPVVVVPPVVSQETAPQTPAAKEPEPLCLPGELRDTIRLDSAAIIEVMLSMAQLDSMSASMDEEEVYTGSDDANYYSFLLGEGARTAGIALVYSEADHLVVFTPDSSVILHKELNAGLSTYFYFDGNDIVKTDLFTLTDLFPAPVIE